MNPLPMTIRLALRASAAILCAILVPAAAAESPSSRGEADVLPAQDLDRVFTLDEAAQFLRVAPAEVERSALDGALPGRRIGQEWRFSKIALIQWLNQDRPLRIAAATPGPSGAAAAGAAPLRRTELAQIAGRGAAAGAPAAAPPQAVGERPAARTAEEVALRDSALLLRKGQSALEFGLSYARAEKTFLPTLRTEQSTATASLSIRHGLRDNLQLSASLPYRTQRTTLYAPDRLSTHSNQLGDAALGLLGVAWRENSGRPALIWSLSAIAPTGPGDAGIGAGASLTRSLDPVVLFASMNYLHGIRTDINDPDRNLAKHNLAYNAGFAFAANDSVAFAAQLIGSRRNYGRNDSGIWLPREQHQLQLGLTYLLSPGLYVEPTVAFGLGSSTPDVTLGINIPYNF